MQLLFVCATQILLEVEKLLPLFPLFVLFREQMSLKFTMADICCPRFFLRGLHFLLWPFGPSRQYFLFFRDSSTVLI